jgi:hypothetical protein
MFCACPAFSRVFDFTRVVVQVPWLAEVTALFKNKAPENGIINEINKN